MTKSYLFIVFCLLTFQFPIYGETEEALVGPKTSEVYSQLSEDDDSTSSKQRETARDVASNTNFALPIPKVNLSVEEDLSPKQLTLGLRLVVLLTLITLAPSILIMMTPFTRIVIVLSFTRRAIGTQTLPSDKLLVSLALFLTIFHMAPIWNKVQENAIEPYVAEEIGYQEMFTRALKPFREYMRKATREKDLAVFVKLSQGKKPKSFEEVSTLTLIPAFIISEFKTGFQFGIILFLPFLMLDMVIATTLMSMGMMMLPPAMVSTPFKILLFVLIDGWALIINALMKSIIVS